ncbi:MAG TPA: prepilin-type N-terminal cleavage/methylation domain-containing protein [Armatimonadota bacterium]|nr:prepilin-type N-terminal cleavage/methylation domain-containing protein [Armatimonadota bacterium]
MLKRKQGFTLIELLVVIAIIAILAAILFPVFARAREKARTSTCQSNGKQIAMAILSYVQDYDETYPRGQFGWVYRWNDAIAPYIKNTQVFKCPSATNENGYGWNTVFFGDAVSKTEASIAYPAETMVIVDSSDNFAAYQNHPATWYGGPRPRHNDMSMVAHVDGHVKVYPNSGLWPPDGTNPSGTYWRIWTGQ